MAYVELKVGSIIVYPRSLEVVTSIVRTKSNDLYYKVARTKLLHQDSKGATRAYYWNILGKNSYYISECTVVNLSAEEVAKVKGDLNMLSKLCAKAKDINEVYSLVHDNRIPQLIEGLKPKLDLSAEVQNILASNLMSNKNLKLHKEELPAKNTQNPLGSDLDIHMNELKQRNMVSKLVETIVLPNVTKASIDVAMTMHFGQGIFNTEGNV